MTDRARRLITAAALVLGLGLLAATIATTDFASAGRALQPLLSALPIVLLPGAIWHLLRTEAWRRSFSAGTRIPFGRAFRIRLAAEAFSFVTIRGIGGEPLKVIWLGPDVPAMISAAAVALERVAYLVVTSAFLGIFSAIAILTLPLTEAWLHVFGWLCAVSLAFAAAPLLLVRRHAGGVAEDRPVQPSNVIRRFSRQLAAQFRALAECERDRLASLVALEAAAFAAMALEVWVVLALTDAPVTMFGAVAIETFTRAASTASAFIPANLGALEASNVAAAVALQAASGAAVLAIARRLRGLVWCVAGFLIYPRTPRRSPSAASTSASAPPSTSALHGSHSRTLLAIEDARASISIARPLGGLPIGERICRAAARDGYTRVLVWAPQQRTSWERIARRVGRRIPVAVLDDAREWRERLASIGDGAVVMMPVPGVKDDEGLAIAERQLRQSIFKPTDGPLARFNRRLSIPISVALIRWMRFSAHAMSLFVIALGLYAGWLFSRGTYATGVLAAAISLFASVLDGCDGELARLQYKESALGCWIDTLGDYSYYLAIFAGLTIGAVRQTGLTIFWWLGVALGAGVLLTFALLILLRWRTTNGRPERLRTTTAEHFRATRKRWAAFAVWLAGSATRATMPYGILAFALLDILPAVVVLATIGANAYWIGLARELRALLDTSKSPAPAVADLTASS